MHGTVQYTVQATTDHLYYCYTTTSQHYELLLQLPQTEGLKLEPNGELIPADVVVANADLPYVELNLLPEQFSRKGLAEAAYSSGVVAFYWACDQQWPQLEHHTVFLSTDWEGSWTRVFRDNKLGTLSLTLSIDTLR
jgi:phytoene dehydrogenase-like protein